MSDVGAAVEGAIEESGNTDIAQPGSLASIAEAAFDKAVAEEGNDDGKTTDTDGAEGETIDEPETGKDKGADDAGGTEEPTEPDGDSEKGDEEGYFADEGQDEVEKEDLATDKGNPTDMGSWVLEQLPSIQVVGVNKEGEQVSISVKRAEDLPTDFEFSNKRDELIFSQNIADQTNRAVNLISKWNNDQQQASATKFSEQENRDIQGDIASLQREGVLNRFRYQPNDERFEKDPAVKTMQEVLDYYNAENQKRYTESQRTGRLFSRLSYRDAFYLNQRANTASKQSTAEQTKADTSRKAATKVLAKGAKSQGDAGTTNRPRLRKNAGVDEIIEAYGLE